MVSNNRDGTRCQPQQSAQIANSRPFGHLQQLTVNVFPSMLIDMSVKRVTAFSQPGHVIALQDKVLHGRPHRIGPKDRKKISFNMFSATLYMKGLYDETAPPFVAT